MATESTFEQVRAALWARFGDATTRGVADLHVAFDALLASPEDERLREHACGLAHAIAGSAGVYGFQEEARAAVELERLLRAWPVTDAAERARPHLDQLATGFRP